MDKKIIEIAKHALLANINDASTSPHYELIKRADKLLGENKLQVVNALSPRITSFDRLELNTKKKAENDHYLPLELLRLKGKSLWPEQSANQTSKIPIIDPENHLEEILSQLKQSTWAAAAPIVSESPIDTSFYDHCRMRAALAVCLADENTTDELILVGGDISGIQEFIYTISSKRAAQTLRGRSFYLQLLTEAILRFVLKKLQLPYVNVIYSGGGHFFILAPASSMNTLKDLQSEISKKLLNFHGIQFYFALGHSKFPLESLTNGDFPKHWKEMHDNLGAKKRQRYKSLNATVVLDQVFTPTKEQYQREAHCSVCGGDKLKTIQIEDGEDRICTLCESFYLQIGKELARTNFIALGINEPKPLSDTNANKKMRASDVLESFGLSFEFIKNKDEWATTKSATEIILWSLDDIEDAQWPLPPDNREISKVARFAVNHMPRNSDGDIMTFDAMQDKFSEEFGGIKRLGVLRMDVDDLGLIFQKGYGTGENSIATLPRLATLSFQLSLFFEGWVKKICESYGDRVYAVYAGGDDVFLIGDWRILPELALKIVDDFKRYTANHPALSISGGMTFIHGKYPVYQAAADAGGAEKQAKAMDGKDAFSFLGQVYHWKDFKEVVAHQEHLVEMMVNNRGPRSILQTLRQLAIDQEAAGTLWGPWMWRGAYTLYRLEKQYEKRNAKVSNGLSKIREEFKDHKNIKPLGLAARWAQLMIRD